MQEKNLSVILDALSNVGIYVIGEREHELLYFNRRIRELIPEAEPGMKYHDIWREICPACPLLVLEEEKSNHTIRYNTPFGEVVDMTVDRTVWDGNIPAFIVTVIPHEHNSREEQRIRQFGEIYAKSLVTVFHECIIANLTQDYYVNYQMDRLWDKIPGNGNFGTENLRYAELTIHPADLEQFKACFSREALLKLFREGKSQISKRLRRKMEDGGYHMAEFTAARIDGKDEDFWCVLVFRDVNEEYLQEQQKNIEMSQLAAAVRNAYQMLIAVNLTKNSYYMMEYSQFRTRKAGESGNFDSLIEVGASTVDPEFREEFIRKFSRENLLKAFAKGEKQVSMELRQMGDDGNYYWNYTQVVRVESPYTDDVLEITLSRSIDEERQEQEYRLRKERQARELLKGALEKAKAASMAKSDFMSRMSHDIRTPMNAIMGMTALAQIHIGDEARLKEYLKNIEISSSHLLGLINEVLDVSRIESGKVELEEAEFDLRELIQDALSIVRPAVRDKGQELSVNIPEAFHAHVSGDDQRLRQVLVNILDNASKYTRPGGKISLSLKEMERAANGLGTYQIAVSDTGIGMKREYLEHIYEPFSRADDSNYKAAGTGLGMTIVQNIIHLMGGDIRVESEYGKGTCFTITVCLRQKDTPLAGREEDDGDAKGDFHGIRILLVEDNSLNQQIAMEMLAFLGAEVELADNGEKAVEAVLGKPPFYYDLVFMDIQMPVMNGYEAAARIRSSGKEGIDGLPIIAMTADAFSEDIKKSRLAGMSGHLSKPISMDKLQKALRSCVKWEEENKRRLP